MSKLLKAFTADQSFTNAKKVVQYAIKHPMSLCLMTPEMSAIYNQAEALYQDA